MGQYRKLWLLANQPGTLASLQPKQIADEPDVRLTRLQQVHARLVNQYVNVPKTLIGRVSEDVASDILQATPMQTPFDEQMQARSVQLSVPEQRALQQRLKRLEKQALTSLADLEPVGHQFSVNSAKHRLLKVLYLPGSEWHDVQSAIEQLTQAVVQARSARKILQQQAEPVLMQGLAANEASIVMLSDLFVSHFNRPSANYVIQLHLDYLQRVIDEGAAAHRDKLALLQAVDYRNLPHDRQLQVALGNFWQGMLDRKTRAQQLVPQLTTIQKMAQESTKWAQTLQHEVRSRLQLSRQMPIANEPVVIGAQKIMQTMLDDHDIEIHQLSSQNDWFWRLLAETTTAREQATTVAQQSLLQGEQQLQQDQPDADLLKAVIVLENTLADRKTTTRDLLRESQRVQKICATIADDYHMVLAEAYTILREAQPLANEPVIAQDLERLQHYLTAPDQHLTQIQTLSMDLREAMQHQWAVRRQIQGRAEDLMNQVRTSAVAHEVQLEHGVLSLQMLLLQTATTRQIMRTIQRLKQDYIDAQTARQGALALAQQTLQETAVMAANTHGALREARLALKTALQQHDPLTAQLVTLSRRCAETAQRY
jgi:hypothetical protein